MGLFDKKKTYAFSDILKGGQYAINSAQDMLQAQQIQGLQSFGMQPIFSCRPKKLNRNYSYRR